MRAALDTAAERLRAAGLGVESAMTLHDIADINARHQQHD